MDACINPDILRVIWFFMLILDIIKIIIPIALIVLGIVDFSKAMITSDENVQRKSGKLFTKRFLYAILIFVLPWLIEVLMITLGNLSVLKGNEINFTDCFENANNKCVEALDSFESVYAESDKIIIAGEVYDEVREVMTSCDVSDSGIYKLLNSKLPQDNFYMIKYYNEDGVTVDEYFFPSFYDLIRLKSIKNPKTGCMNFGWRQKEDKNNNVIKDILSIDFNSIKEKGSVELVPVWNEQITIDYYYEDGVTLYESQNYCMGESLYISKLIEKEGYVMRWKIETFETTSNENNTISVGQTITFSENAVFDGRIKLVAVYELQKYTV